MFDRAYFLWCIHFATASLLLLSMSRPSCSAIASFSCRQSVHLFVLGLYVLALRKISQVTSGVPPRSLILQISFESSLSPRYFRLLKDFLCSLIRSLVGLSVIPLYLLGWYLGRLEFTVPWYKTSGVKQWPPRGHCSGFRQLHFRFLSVDSSLMTFLLWPLIIDFMLGIEL